ncbi:deoxyribodipyrimidine photo-lyase, partial [Winogradskyella sp.]|nr:deoxyribodipyrimidine photo-lyase [Winogradskyella sp.]
MDKKINIFWFRRDLRLDDNVGFYKALQSDASVLPIFIF